MKSAEPVAVCLQPEAGVTREPAPPLCHARRSPTRGRPSATLMQRPLTSHHDILNPRPSPCLPHTRPQPTARATATCLPTCPAPAPCRTPHAPDPVPPPLSLLPFACTSWQTARMANERAQRDVERRPQAAPHQGGAGGRGWGRRGEASTGERAKVVVGPGGRTEGVWGGGGDNIWQFVNPQGRCKGWGCLFRVGQGGRQQGEQGPGEGPSLRRAECPGQGGRCGGWGVAIAVVARAKRGRRQRSTWGEGASSGMGCGVKPGSRREKVSAVGRRLTHCTGQWALASGLNLLPGAQGGADSDGIGDGRKAVCVYIRGGTAMYIRAEGPYSDSRDTVEPDLGGPRVGMPVCEAEVTVGRLAMWVRGHVLGWVVERRPAAGGRGFRR